jgi:adenylate kinase
MNESPLVIILLGKSGSGKGTQVSLLKDRYNLNSLSSGDMLRQRKQVDDFSGRKMASVIDKGGIISTPVIFKLWMDKFEEFKDAGDFKGIILDGSPRKIKEAWLMDEALAWFEWDKRIKILLIDVSDDEVIKRITMRKICPKCGNIVIDAEDNMKICPKCGGELIKRPDDTLEGTKTRLQWFEEEVGQVIKHYEDQGKLIRINGEQSVEAVFNDIVKEIDNDND